MADRISTRLKTINSHNKKMINILKNLERLKYHLVNLNKVSIEFKLLERARLIHLEICPTNYWQRSIETSRQKAALRVHFNVAR